MGMPGASQVRSPCVASLRGLAGLCTLARALRRWLLSRPPLASAPVSLAWGGCGSRALLAGSAVLRLLRG
eukprot:2235689-Alexandrium_andersonii.AAC.1